MKSRCGTKLSRAKKDQLEFLGGVKIRDSWLTGSIVDLERFKALHRERFFKEDLSIVYLEYLENYSFCPILAKEKHKKYVYTETDILQLALNECLSWVMKYNCDISQDVLMSTVGKFCEVLELGEEQTKITKSKCGRVRRAVYEKKTFGTMKINYPAAITIGKTQIRHLIPAIWRHPIEEGRPNRNKELTMVMYSPIPWRDNPVKRSVLYQFLQVWAMEEMQLEAAKIQTMHINDEGEAIRDNLFLKKDCSDSRANLGNIISKLQAPASLPHIAICNACEIGERCNI